MVLFILIVEDHKTGWVEASLFGWGFLFYFVGFLVVVFCLLCKQEKNSIKQMC